MKFAGCGSRNLSVNSLFTLQPDYFVALIFIYIVYISIFFYSLATAAHNIIAREMMVGGVVGDDGDEFDPTRFGSHLNPTRVCVSNLPIRPVVILLNLNHFI